MNHDMHSPSGAKGSGGHGDWLMMACCVPMLIIVAALVVSGTISLGFMLFALACAAMMFFMMRAMPKGANDKQGPPAATQHPNDKQMHR